MDSGFVKTYQTTDVREGKYGSYFYLMAPFPLQMGIYIQRGMRALS